MFDLGVLTLIMITSVVVFQWEIYRNFYDNLEEKIVINLGLYKRFQYAIFVNN